jgi:hypothetical protein
MYKLTVRYVLSEEVFGTGTPDSSPLVDALSNALQEADAVCIQGSVALLEALGHPSSLVRREGLAIIEEIGANLCNLIIKDPLFPGETPIRLWGPQVIRAFYPKHMASSLVQRLVRTRDPEGTPRMVEKGTANRIG